MSSLSPKHSLSLPTTATSSNGQVLPTPSSSATVRQSKQQILRHELEQQLAEKKKQLEESSSGIGKNVLARQVNQLQERINGLEKQKLDGSDESLLTTDKLRSLERDLADYRKPPGIRNKRESFTPQRASMSTGLDPLPSPTTSSLLPHHDSTSLLPLPPPPTGSTPTKRRSKVPNTDRRNTDIEFATEIGQGLLLEVRKMQALLQEKEEKLRTLENQKADLERAAEAMAKQMRQTEENEEKLKEETWNLELAKQELTISVTELQQNLNKANAEQNRLAKQVNTLRSEIEQLRDREEKLNSTIESMKSRHEQDMSSIRRHAAALQREKTDQTKKIESLTSELAIAKAQSRITKHVTPELEPSRPNQIADPTLAESIAKSEALPDSSPPSSPEQLPARNQAMEVETLKTTLAHAHRMVSNLRSNLHKEKTEKFELKKLLAESQETIEQLQNDPRLWVDARPVRSSSSHLTSSKEDGGRRPHKASAAKRRGRKSSNAATKRVKSKNTSLSLFAENESTLSYSSLSENSEEESENDIPSSPIGKKNMGFTTLSSELSQSQVVQKPIAVDAEINTDPVHIEAVPLLSETPQSSKDTHPVENVVVGGLVAASIGFLVSAKQGIEIPTQTEIEPEAKPEIVEAFVQTVDAAVPSVTLSTQTDESRLEQLIFVDTFIQTEAKPEGIESFVQTASESPKLVAEISTQTDTKPEGIEGSVQTVADLPKPVVDTSIQTEDKSECVETFVQTTADLPKTVAEISTQTDAKPEGTEILVQTMAELPKAVAEISTQTDVKPEGTEILVQTTPETCEVLVQTEEIQVIKEQVIAVHADTQHDFERGDAGIQTSLIETKDAQVQCEADALHESSGLPLYLSSSQSTYRPLTDDEDNDSCYYDANSEVFQSKPSSRNTISSLAAYNELSPRHSWKSAVEEPILRKTITPRISRTESLLAFKPTPIHALVDTKPASSLENEKEGLAKEKKMFSKEETDNLIAAAVAIALAEAKENNVRDLNADHEQEEDNGFGNVVVHISSSEEVVSVEKRISVPELTNGPSIVYGQEPEEHEWTEDDVPQRPSNPPPIDLLTRAMSPHRLSTVRTTDVDGDNQLSLHKNNRSMSSLSSANTNEQILSVTSSHFDNRTTSGTDPNMISLITKTMIGDWMWKYTRKPVGGGISENRHQRYFWIHPYTRTLYWSNKSPGIDPSQTKAKSALIENITAVPDFSTNPEGLPNVSLLIQTSHRQLKLTAPSMEKHDDWFESINHLVTRSSDSSLRLPVEKSKSTEPHSSLIQKPSFRRLHDMFHQPSSSTSTATGTHTSDINDYDEEDDPLEDVRMCCNGKHHVSKLERDHTHRHQYRKRSSRIPANH